MNIRDTEGTHEVADPATVSLLGAQDQPSPPPLPAHLQILKEERDRQAR